MIDFTNIKKYLITPENILANVSQEQIFAFYLGKDIRLGECISSPLRRDKNPSWNLFASRNGNILYKDFSTGESGDCFKLVCRLYNINYYEALLKINEDFQLGLVSYSDKIYSMIDIPEYKVYRKSSKSITFTVRKRFNKEDLSYWNSFNIDEELLRYYNVIPVDKVFIENKVIWYSYMDNPIYGYLFNKDLKKSFKLYRPLESDKQKKWMGTCDGSVLQGWNQLNVYGDMVIITKSMKDSMVLRTMGYDSISPQGESMKMGIKVVDELFVRFGKVYILFDNDESGISGARYFTDNFGIIPFFLPIEYKETIKIKDISDYVKYYGFEYSKKLVQKMIYEAYIR